MTPLTPRPTRRSHGILFILSGPSGVGKDTILRLATPEIGPIYRSISYTTRGPRLKERHGRDYYFVSRETFAEMQERDEFLESAPVHHDWYGTPRTLVATQLAQGIDVILEIDVQGALHVRAQYPDAVMIFLAPPNMAELEHRLRRRDSENEEKLRTRLANARGEVAMANAYDYVIINDTIEEAVRQFRAVVTAERCRATRLDLQALLSEERRDG